MNTSPTSLHHSFEQHTELLHERGYLGESFGNNAKVGSWLLEFKRMFEQYRQLAVEEGLLKKFTIVLHRKFNAGLQTIKIDLRYSYDPTSDAFSLNSLYARLGKYAKPYYFGQSNDLPNIVDVRSSLTAPDLSNNNTSLFIEALNDFHRNKNPDNDYLDERPKYVPPKKISNSPTPPSILPIQPPITRIRR